MQFESLSNKKKNIYLRNKYLHQLYTSILENIQQLHNYNIRLAKENEILINHCINIDYNGKYLNYDENKLKEDIMLSSKSLNKNNDEIKKINYEKVSSTIESIINEEFNENKLNSENVKSGNFDENKEENNINMDLYERSEEKNNSTNASSHDNINFNNHILEETEIKRNEEDEELKLQEVMKLSKEELLEQKKTIYDDNDNSKSSSTINYNDVSNTNNNKGIGNTDNYDNNIDIRNSNCNIKSDISDVNSVNNSKLNVLHNNHNNDDDKDSQIECISNSNYNNNNNNNTDNNISSNINNKDNNDIDNNQIDNNQIDYNNNISNEKENVNNEEDDELIFTLLKKKGNESFYI